MKNSDQYVRPLDAVDLLRKDHGRLKQLFVDFFAARTNRRDAMIPHLCTAVERHLTLDADIFFPFLADTLADEHLGSIAIRECRDIKNYVEEILHPDPCDFGLSERVHRLAHMMSHHIDASETPDGAFAKALRATVDLTSVGQDLRKRQWEWRLADRQTIHHY